MRIITRVLCTGVLFAFPALASAQDGGPIWVAGRLILDVDSSFGAGTFVGPGGGMAVGVDGRRFGFELAFDWPASHTSEDVDAYPCQSGISSCPQLGQERVTVRQRRSSSAWNALVAVHPWSGTRVRLSLVAGMANVVHRFEVGSIVVEGLGPTGTVVNRNETTLPVRSYWWPGFTYGVDAIIDVRPHLAFVCDLRVTAFPLADSEGAFLVRPAAALRWTF